MCVGHIERLRRLERSERQLNWMIYCSFGDPKKMPKSAHHWWPIQGDVIRKIKPPSKRALLKFNEIFKNLGNRKNG